MNKREINKLEREMQQIVSLMNHTTDIKGKIQYAEKLYEITPIYQRQLHLYQIHSGGTKRWINKNVNINY